MLHIVAKKPTFASENITDIFTDKESRGGAVDALPF